MPRSYGVTNVAPWAAAPAVGSAGSTYYNTTDGKLYVSTGAAWVAVAGSGAAEVNVSTAGPSPRVGELLWVDTDDVVPSGRIGAEAYCTVARALTVNNWHDVAMDAVSFDSSAYWSAATPARLTVPAGLAGVHTVQVYLASPPASSQLGIRKGNAATSAVAMRKQYQGILDALSWTGWLAVGDWVALTLYTGGGNYGVETAGINNPPSPLIHAYRWNA